MKSIHKIISAFVLFVLISSTAFAAGNKLTVEQKATIRMQKINSVCNLTAQQQEQVKQLFVTAITNRRASHEQKGDKALKSNGTSGKKDLQANRKLNQQNLKSGLNAILTTDQAAKWKAYKQSQK